MKSVSRIAATAFGSVTAARYADGPFRSACAKTDASGRKTKRPRNASGGRDQGAADGGALGERRRGSEAAARHHRGGAGEPSRQALEGVRGEDEPEGGEEEDDRDRGRPGLVVLLELRDDQEGRDLRLHREVPRDEHDRPVFPERPREREGEPRQERGEEVREDDAEERLQTRGPEDPGRFLELGVEVLEDGLDGAHDERQADEREREDDARRGEGDLQAERLEEPSDPAVARVERGQREAGDRGGQCERKVDERVEERPAAEAIAREDPRHEQAEDRVEERGEERGAEAQPVGGESPRRRDDTQEIGAREARGPQREGGERKDDDETHVEACEGNRRRESREDAVPARPAHRGPCVSWSKTPPSSKWAFWALVQPPATSSIVKSETLGNSAACRAAAAAERGR